MNSYGFALWIASNSVTEDDTSGERGILLHLDGKDFTEANIRKVFTSLAAKYPSPHGLRIDAYSDRAKVQKALDQQESGVAICVAYSTISPETHRASRNRAILDEGRQSGFYRAHYFRPQLMAKRSLSIVLTLSRNTSAGLI